MGGGFCKQPLISHEHPVPHTDSKHLAIQRTICENPMVDNFSALPPEWKDNLQVHSLFQCSTIQRLIFIIDQMFARKANGEKLTQKDITILQGSLKELLELCRPKLHRRLILISTTLTSHGSSTAQMQVHTAVETLSKYYRKLYDGIYQVIELNENGNMEHWIRRISNCEQQLQYKKQSLVVQSTNDMFLTYYHAALMLPMYQNFVRRFAKKTGGAVCLPGLKKISRSLEKTSIRADGERRMFQTDVLYDVVRGAVMYLTMEALVKGLEELLNTQTIEILRIKNRLKPGGETDAGWRDVVINCRLKNDLNRHVAEIQLHHQSMMVIRQQCGGHAMYASFRGLKEAQDAAEHIQRNMLMDQQTLLSKKMQINQQDDPVNHNDHTRLQKRFRNGIMNRKGSGKKRIIPRLSGEAKRHRATAE